MSENVSGIRGEYRRFTSSEIGKIVHELRSHRGIKAAVLAKLASVGLRTVERIEAAKGVNDESYGRVATALGLPTSIFTDTRYRPSPEELDEAIHRWQKQFEAGHFRLTVKRIVDVRDVLAFLSADGHIFEDAQVDLDHVAAVAALKDSVTDWLNIAEEIDAVQKLECANNLLKELRDVERLGYVAKAGRSNLVSAATKIPLGLQVIVLFRAGQPGECLPNEVWVPRNL